jgi:isoquinoline 1-oxidoreductase beta subunit
MGQGSLTGLAQLVAEELDCDWAKVSTEFASPNEHIKRKRIWGSMSTGGSAGVRTSQEYLRKVGRRGARDAGVGRRPRDGTSPRAECSAEKGVITHAGSKRKTELRQGRRGRVQARDAQGREAARSEGLEDRRQVAQAPRDARQGDGQAHLRRGRAAPNMLHASIVQSPVFLGKVKSVDSAEAEKMRGVKGIVKQEGWVAVVADNWWRANQAARALKIQWDDGANGAVSTESIMALLKEGLAAKDLPTARKMGDAPGMMSAAAQIVESEYSSPYLSHATMEPMTSTAWFKPDGTLEVWTSTQNGEASIAAASEAAGIRSSRSRCTRPCSAADSVAAARRRTTCARAWPSPSSSRTPR